MHKTCTNVWFYLAAIFLLWAISMSRDYEEQLLYEQHRALQQSALHNCIYNRGGDKHAAAICQNLQRNNHL